MSAPLLRAPVSLLVAFSLVAVVPAASLACSKKTPSDAASPSSYQTKGIIKSFGPDRKFVNIAHETIPGYMAAMTMSFEPGQSSQLDGLAAGDRVSFSFNATDDGKRVIVVIKKDP